MKLYFIIGIRNKFDLRIGLNWFLFFHNRVFNNFILDHQFQFFEMWNVVRDFHLITTDGNSCYVNDGDRGALKYWETDALNSELSQLHQE
jgi:hypothetical protein